ncbi:MAG TPA: protease SohB [Gammaproteobacteria bacterium]|nr:protease SohB [Gammaproteobacteria bacterium]HRA42142.1 protease SohB [Gammaproteobacteria bacterium]
MSTFFFEYGLFAAKMITILAITLAAIAGCIILFSTRQQEKESIQIEKINDKFDNMRDALEETLLSKDEYKALKKDRKKEDKAEEKRIKIQLKKGEQESLRPRLFVLRFDGDMHASEVDSLREAITAILLVAKKEDEVLLILDSSGGLVHNYGLAASELHRIRQRNIPLTVCIDLVAASGGYMMAAVANKIIAAPFAVVGSIGVLAQVPNFFRLLKKHDIDIEQHTAGEYKTTLTMLGENTNKAREKFREELEDTHLLFKQFVHENRPSLDIEKLATGEHWYGTQAVDLKLVDELMTSDDYLLSKNETTDIYEVSYVFSETLTDKLSTILHGVTSRLLQRFFKIPLY